jgi:twitching motility protein PilT
MSMEHLIRIAIENRATDVHLEPAQPAVMRVNGSLKRFETPLSSDTLNQYARRFLSESEWDQFETRGSADISKKISGVQCRINILQSDRGIGFAIRLLGTTLNTLKSCNLMPSIGEFLKCDSGLILLVGPTGSGKTTTLSAMVEEINQNETRHIITLESPIEYRIAAKKSIVRQREVGKHTPSYEQGLLDSLREDPDVLVVGEMREPEAMRLTLNAAETGHLVLATMHSSSGMDAVYRMMMSFPAERQSSVLAQLADTLVAIVSQRMTFRSELKLMVPCLEILIANHAVKNVIRKGEVSKFISLLQSGGPEGMYTFDRYQTWLDQKNDWVYPEPPVAVEEAIDTELNESFQPSEEMKPLSDKISRRTKAHRSIDDDTLNAAIQNQLKAQNQTIVQDLGFARKPGKSRGQAAASITKIHKDGRIEIPEVDLDLNELVKEFKGRED